MNVLFVNRSYWPDTEATGQLLTELCESLAANDEFQITALVGKPNSVVGETSNWSGVSQKDAVTILRVRHTNFGKRSTLLKAVNFVTFTIMAFVRSVWLPRKLHPDVVVVETDPFLLPFLGRFLRWRYRCRLICYLQDIYPDVAVAVGKVRDAAWVRFLRRKLFNVYRRADRVVVLSDDMKSLLVRAGIDSDRISIIPNWVDAASIVPVDPLENPARQKFDLQPGDLAVMYSGNMGLTQRLDILLEVARALRSEPQIRFVLVGNGAMRAELESRAAGLANVSFFDYQPKSELAQSLSAADIHYVPIQPSLVGCLMPSKLYGVLAVGRPVITSAPMGSELYEVVAGEGRVGEAVAPEDVESLRDAILSLASSPDIRQAMGRRARALCESRFQKHHSVERFAGLLREIRVNASTPDAVASA